MVPAVEVRLAESALADLMEIRLWYLEQGVPDVAKQFVAEILARVEALADFPDIGRVVPEFQQARLRELVHRPFRVVYRREPQLVRVVRIWRSERQLTEPG